MNPAAEIPISETEFRSTIERLFTNGLPGGFPKKRRDQLILLCCACLALESGQVLDHRQIDQALRGWLAAMHVSGPLDHVSLRRHLVDDGFLERDDAGQDYQVRADRATALLSPSALDCEPAAICTAARARRREQAMRYRPA